MKNSNTNTSNELPIMTAPVKKKRQTKAKPSKAKSTTKSTTKAKSTAKSNKTMNTQATTPNTQTQTQTQTTTTMNTQATTPNTKVNVNTQPETMNTQPQTEDNKVSAKFKALNLLSKGVKSVTGTTHLALTLGLMATEYTETKLIKRITGEQEEDILAERRAKTTASIIAMNNARDNAMEAIAKAKAAAKAKAQTAHRTTKTLVAEVTTANIIQDQALTNNA